MDPSKFDEFTKALATKISRRQALKTFTGITVGGLLGLLGVENASAASCTAQSCPNGCCTAKGCKPGTSSSDCGKGGATCASCAKGLACVNGACTGGSSCTAQSCPNGC